MAENFRLPPLQALVFFESAARHLNFSAAARELGTTQPAVSHRISQIEDELGTPLFKRIHRGVALTVEGMRLLEAVRQSLDVLKAATADIRARHARKVMTLAVDFGFAAYWLMPRLPSLRQELPDLEVRIVASEDDFDIRGEPVDFAISFGTGHWDGCHAEMLFPEKVVPVCSPAFLKAHAPVKTPRDLAPSTLLHLENTGPARWLRWIDWFSFHDITPVNPGGGLSFNNYTLVMQAAIAGQGVALGWIPLIEDLLRTGQLVSALKQPHTTHSGYFLVEPIPRRMTEPNNVFREWITRCATQKPAAPKRGAARK